jgi:hypothetical protein
MKKIILLFITIAMVGIWISIDKKMFFYGRNIFNYNLLPQKIYPEFRHDFEGGFTIFDKYGFSLLARGFPLANGVKENVKNIIEYGYNDKSILVSVETEKNKTRYVQITSDQKSRTGLFIKVFKEKTGKKKYDKYKWINIEKSTPYFLERSHNLLQPLLIMLFLYWIFFIFLKLFRLLKDFTNKARS